MDVVVTTTRRPTADDIWRAQRYARALATVYVAREGLSFPAVLERAAELRQRPVTGVLVVNRPQLSVWTEFGVLQYHPGMALHRVAALRRGEPDTMVSAMELRPGDRVLDCTAGLAADAVVASYAVGCAGKVIALESVPVIALLLKTGLRTYPGQGPALTNSMRRVRVKLCEHTRMLARCQPGSFDVVYFDPMFTVPVTESSGIAPLRPLADYSPLQVETLEMARRVARRMVVVKERCNGPLTTIWPWDDIRGGKKSSIAYLIKYSNG